MLRVFIGYDPREAVAYSVLAHSIVRRASRPVAIVPLVRQQLVQAGLYWRERGPTESTEFSLTRFLVPCLAGYWGHSIFMDCDMLCQGDVWELLDEHVRQNATLSVVQHDYQPTSTTKFLGQPQTRYPRKNWSSVMVFTNAGCKALTADYVNTASGLDLHRFVWLREGQATGQRLGALPLAWNWLVGEYEPNPQAKLLHYTLGGPWFPETRNCDHAEAWFDELADLVPGGTPLSVSAGH